MLERKKKIPKKKTPLPLHKKIIKNNTGVSSRLFHLSESTTGKTLHSIKKKQRRVADEIITGVRWKWYNKCTIMLP